MKAPLMTRFFSALVLVGLFYSQTALADDVKPLQAPAAENQLLLKQNLPTHPEHILLAYFKLAGIHPDFTKWAALSPFLDNAKDSEIGPIISRESNRLSLAYTQYDVGTPIDVHTSINLDDYSTLNGVLNFNEFSARTFFTYSLYGENIAIVPRDIKNFATIPMTKDKMDVMLGKARGSRITAELLLKPTVADSKAPFLHDGAEYRLLLADIAEIRFWTPDKTEPQLLWTWRADWYTPKTDQQLLDLKAQEAH